MAQVITMKVQATDAGSLKKLVAQLKAAGHEIDMVATSHKRAGAAAEDHHSRLNKGAAGVGNSTKSFSKMASSINGDNNSLVGAYAALAANIFAVTAAFSALKNASELEQVLNGLDASGVRLGLTYSLVTERVKDAAGGLLSLKQSAVSSAQVLAAGFKSDDIVRLTKVAKDASFALGRDMGESMDRLTRGAVKLEPELLDELGIMVRLDEASTTYARTLNKTASQLTATEKHQGFMNAVLAEGEAKFGGISAAAGNTTSLTKLAATFTDLTTNIFKFINLGAIPLAKIFSSSPLALAGGMLLFASTIKGQVIPGLVDVSKKAAKTASDAEKLSTAIAVNSVNSAKYNNEFSASFRNMIKNIENGSATIDDVRSQAAKSAAELKQSIEYPGANSRSTTVLQNEVKSTREIAAARLLAASIGQKADAAKLASEGKVSKAIEATHLSTVLYAESLEYSSKKMDAGSKAGNKLKTAVVGVSTAAKTAGLAFLQFLPWIGLVFTAVGLLTTGLLLLAGKGFKEATEATKNYNTVLESLTDKVKEYNRLNTVAINDGTRQVQQYTIITNSVVELTDAMNKAIEAQNSLSGFGRVLQETANYYNVPRNFKKTKVQAAYTNQNTGVSNFSKEDVDRNLPALSALKQLSESSIPEVAAAAKRELGPEGLSGVLNAEDARLKVEAITKSLRELGPAAATANAAYKELGKSVQDFTKASAISTPFDALSKALDETIISTSQLSSALVSGEIDVNKLVSAFRGIPKDVLNLLPQDVSEIVKGMEEWDNKYKDILSKGEAYQKIHKEELDIAKGNRDSYAQQLLVIQNILYTTREHVLSLQLQSRTLESSNAILQVMSGRYSRHNDLTGEATKKRIEADNTIISNQMKQLEMQNELLKIQLQNIEALKVQDVVYNSIRATLGQITDDSAFQWTVNQIQAQTDTINRGTEEEVSLARVKLREAQALQNVLIERLGLETSARDLQASITNNDQKRLALQLQLTSDLVKKLEVNLKIKKAAKELFSLESQRDAANLKYATTSASIYETETAALNLSFSRLKTSRDATTLEEKNLLIKEHEMDKAETHLAVQKATEDGLTILAKKLWEEYLLRREIRIIQIDQGELDRKAEEYRSLGLKSAQQYLEVQKSLLENQRELTGSILEAAQAAYDLEKIKADTREVRTGVKDSPLAALDREWRLNATKLDAANKDYKLKMAIINLEFKLLDMQTKKSISDMQFQEEYLYGLQAQGVTLSPEQQAQKGALSAAIDASKEVLKILPDAQKAAESIAKSTLDGITTTASFTNIEKLGAIATAVRAQMQPMLDALKELGPEGILANAIGEGMLNIGDSILKAAASMEEGGSRIQAVLSIVSTVLNTISSIVKSGSDAKLSSIDKEIAAEQARDGKSEASVSKIAAMEKKKDSIARKSFEMQKKLQLANAVVATASGMIGVAAGLAQLPFGAGIPFIPAAMAMMAALGAAQIGIIAGTSYQSSASSASAAATPSAVSVGSRSSSVDLAKNNNNVGGELGYLQGSQGTGSNSSNFSRRAYGGYGHAGMIVGEKGPELFVPSTPGNVVANDNVSAPAPVNATFHINAIDAEGVEEVLNGQKGHIIGMLREAANANGQNFLERVNTAKYSRGGRKL